MKYCTHCGNELLDEAIICPKCGCKVEQPKTVYKAPKELDVAKDELCPKGSFGLGCFALCSVQFSDSNHCYSELCIRIILTIQCMDWSLHLLL